MAELDYGEAPRWAGGFEDEDDDEPLFDAADGGGPELQGVNDIMTGVDALLSRPAPSMRQFASKGGGPSIPVLRKQRSEARRSKAAPAATARRRRPDVVPDVEPDPTAVAEALKYCQGLSMRVADDAPPAAPGRSAAAPPPPKRGGSRRRARGDRPPRPADTMAKAYGSGATRRGKTEFNTKTKGKRRGAELDTAALVANFESGTNLIELRKQLHASQKAMEASASVVRGAAREFHGGAF